MKKIALLIGLMILVLPTVFALDVNVQSLNPNVVLIKGINQPVVFNLSVTNNGASDNLQFYNLVGFIMTPKNAIPFSSGETKIINVTIFPIANLAYSGYYQFNYFIQGQSGDKVSKSLIFKIVDLKNAFLVGASEINPESNSITVYIKNKVNYNFNNLNIKFSSPFFTLNKKISLSSLQEKKFNIVLGKKSFKSLLAGFYTLTADVSTRGKTAKVEGNIKFSEKDILNTSEKNYGFLIFTKVIQKTNNGNILANSQTIIKKNIISRLFTSFNPKPDSMNRQGLSIYYTWENQIKPGDTLTISVKTNWFLPLFIVLFLVGIIVFVKQYSKNILSINKKVSFLKAKGGEFALKVTLVVSARKFVERLTITDRLPQIVKLYNKFGIEKPTRIDEKNRRLEWSFDKLEAGETRVLNYVIYSKVGVLGRFALPTATAVYEREGNISETESNRAFLITEQSPTREN